LARAAQRTLQQTGDLTHPRRIGLISTITRSTGWERKERKTTLSFANSSVRFFSCWMANANQRPDRPSVYLSTPRVMPRLAVHQDHEVVYLVERKRVLIVAVLHGHRALRRALKDRL